ncbi:MAG: hypothetical protein CM15mP14_3690 [Rhodospirillaceae bacterium]|nr:MAG: hypothetical protein CM15mP14_3690 [Rhodospirillaceae bacterium]
MRFENKGVLVTGATGVLAGRPVFNLQQRERPSL